MAIICGDYCGMTCIECRNAKTEYDWWSDMYELTGCKLHPEQHIDEDWGCDDFYCMFADNEVKQVIYSEQRDKDRGRGERRKSDYAKASRKQHITKTAYGWEWYNKSLHQYVKGKIHCSCPLCAAKTRGKIAKKQGVGENWSLKDIKKRESMNEQEEEWEYDRQAERPDDEP